MPQSGRRQADQMLLLALACGATVESAARQAGLSEATAQRRLKEPAFQQALKATQADLVQRTMGMLTGAAGEAVKTLLGLLKDTNPATVRLGAGRPTDLYQGNRVGDVGPRRGVGPDSQVAGCVRLLPARGRHVP